MFCTNCGREIDNQAAVCIHCGHAVIRPIGNIHDAPSGGFAVLGFFIPLAGLILYLVYEGKQPLRAKSAGKGALIGFIARVALSAIGSILYFLFLTSFMGSMMDSFAV